MTSSLRVLIKMVSKDSDIWDVRKKYAIYNRLVGNLKIELGLFGTLKLALALQFIVMNAYFSVACNTKVSVRATLK